MASEAGPGRRRRQVAVALALVAGVGGCVFAFVREAKEPPIFDHGAHIERGLECKDCHAEATTAAKAGMPAAESCADCHVPEEDRPEVTALVARYTSRPKDQQYARGPTYGDVRFDHAAHARGGVACIACHPGAEKEPVATPAGPPRMADCLRCHRASLGKPDPTLAAGTAGAPPGAASASAELRPPVEDCAACHLVTRRDVPPATHVDRTRWTRFHGPASRLDAAATETVEDCALCHAQSSCIGCHQAQPPQDHTNAFRLTTHGLAAAVDRDRCITCHREDSCIRCHEIQPPRSHRGGFGFPTLRHCNSCHLPLGSDACITCHRQGTPSHDIFSPPKTPTAFHRVAVSPVECRSCHRVISHPDRGDDCNGCHR